MIRLMDPLPFIEQDGHLVICRVKLTQHMTWGIRRVADGPGTWPLSFAGCLNKCPEDSW